MQNTVKQPELNVSNEELLNNSKEATSLGIEATPISETVNTSVAPADPAQSDDVTLVDDSTDSVNVTELEKTVTQDELDDLTSSNIESADVNWVGRVKDVIRDDKGQPYKEEEDAEKLNEEYMLERFKVDVDAPIEEK